MFVCYGKDDDEVIESVRSMSLKFLLTTLWVNGIYPFSNRKLLEGDFQAHWPRIIEIGNWFHNKKSLNNVKCCYDLDMDQLFFVLRPQFARSGNNWRQISLKTLLRYRGFVLSKADANSPSLLKPRPPVMRAQGKAFQRSKYWYDLKPTCVLQGWPHVSWSGHIVVITYPIGYSTQHGRLGNAGCIFASNLRLTMTPHIAAIF